MKRSLWLAVLFCGAGGSLWAQVYSSGGPTVNNVGQPVVANVAVCSAKPAGTNAPDCASYVQTYSDSTLLTACTINPSTLGPLQGVGCTNPGTTDSRGNFVIWANSQIAWAEIYGYMIGTYLYPIGIGGGGGGGGGCTPYGSAGDVQENNGTGGCAAAHINDNGTTLTITENITPATAAGYGLGLATLPFANLYIGGSANHSFHFDTSSLSSNVTVYIPNAYSDTVQGIPNPSDAQVVNYIDTSGVQHRIAQTGGGDTITSPFGSINVSGTSTNTHLDVVGAAGYILAGAGPGLTTMPALGEDGVTNGVLTLSNAGASAHTNIATQATSSWTFKFPINAGTNAYVLQTDGSGNTSWVPPTSGGTGCTPIGSSGDLQTNNGSGGCGASHMNDNGTTMTVTESITPASAASKNLGTAPLPFGDGYFGGAANHSFHFDTSAIASNVAVAVPNAASNTVQGIANPSDTNVINYIDASGVQHRIAQSGGGDTITSPFATISVSGTSSNTHLDVVGAAGYILAGAGPGLTAQPTLGNDGVDKGTLTLANDSISAHTVIATQATSNWTFKLPVNAGTSGQFLKTDGSGNTSWASSSSAPQGYSFSGVTTFTIAGATHGLGTKYLILQCYDNANPANFILPAFTVNPTTYDVIVTFTTATSGYCVLI